MGKTHRKVNAGSCSVDYHSPHNRGFAKDTKAQSHHSIRTHNKGCDEDSIDTFNCKHKHMNTHWAASYCGELGNVPNYKGKHINDISLHKNYEYKWTKSDTNMLDSINTIITQNDTISDNYLAASKKQIERRGKVGLFYGHR